MLTQAARALQGFNFKKASIGNLFLSGASLFLGSVRPPFPLGSSSHSAAYPSRPPPLRALVQIPSAIFLFASLTGIAHDRVRVVPVINTSSTVTIAAELVDGQIIAGQSEISHPAAGAPPGAGEGEGAGLGTSAALEQGLSTPAKGSHVGGGGAVLRPESYFPLTRATTPSFPEPPVLGAEEDDSHSELPLSSPPPGSPTSRTHDDAPLPVSPSPTSSSFSLPPPAPQSRNLDFSKESPTATPLPSRIHRIFYLNAYGSEIWPRPNTVFLHALRDASCLVYAPGSLYTSVVPCVALRPVGEMIARGAARLRYKVLLLNSTRDRETPGYDARDFVAALTEACARSFVDAGGEGEGEGEGEEGRARCEPRDVVTHLVWVRNGQVEVDEQKLEVRLFLLSSLEPLCRHGHP